MFGLTEEHWQKVIQLAVQPLKSLGAKVYVFGSRATGKHRPFSDLDLLYEGTIPLSQLSEIKEALEESNLPIKVDLVNQAELASSYISKAEREKKEV